MAFYKISVQNDSGSTASYIVTAEIPRSSGPTSDDFPIVIAKAKVPDSGNSQFTIDQLKPCYAYAIQTQGKPRHGNGVEVTIKKQVTLGKQDQGGAPEPGTTLNFEVVDGSANLKDNGSPSGMRGSFEIQTGTLVASEDKSNHFLIGCGSKSRPWSVFTPQPNVTYQIQPIAILYLTPSEHTEGTIVDVDIIGESLKLDFNELGDDVSVTQGTDGKLSIDK